MSALRATDHRVVRIVRRRPANADEVFSTGNYAKVLPVTRVEDRHLQRGRGQRKRPSSGWAALTPAEIQVVDLACEGLASKEIAVRLFISPRTVHAHLTHIYTKLGVSSRVQLAQVAAEHSD